MEMKMFYKSKVAPSGIVENYVPCTILRTHNKRVEVDASTHRYEMNIILYIETEPYDKFIKGVKINNVMFEYEDNKYFVNNRTKHVDSDNSCRGWVFTITETSN